jgi:hypothetical protein
MVGNTRGSVIMMIVGLIFAVILLSLASFHDTKQQRKAQQLGRAVAKLPAARFQKNVLTGLTEINPDFQKTAEELAKVEGVSVEEASEDLDATRELITDAVSEDIGATSYDIATHIDSAIATIEAIAKQENIDYGRAAQKVAALGELYEAAHSVVAIGEPLKFKNRAERRKYEAEQRDHAKNKDKLTKEIQKKMYDLISKTNTIVEDGLELADKEAIAKDLVEKLGESKKQADKDAKAIIELEQVVDQNAANDKPDVDTVEELEVGLKARKELDPKKKGKKEGVFAKTKKIQLDLDTIEATKTVAALQTSTIKRFSSDFEDGTIYERLKSASHTLHGLAQLGEKAAKHVPAPNKAY